VQPVYEEPRPSFANDLEPLPEPEPRRSGGFSLFGWRKPEPRDDGPVNEINLDEGFGEFEEPRSRDEPVRDPALDEELEIPAFLRRQMTPR